MQSVDSSMLSRIYGDGRGSVFTPSRFLDLGSRDAVDKVLSRLVQKGTIRRLARGLYDYPEHHQIMGILAPSPDAIAQALAGKQGIRLQPSGAYAANRLGLSTQVPARIVYLTDGPSRTVRVGNQEIRLQRTTPRIMGPSDRISGLVIQALRHLGQRHVDDTVIQTLQRKLSDQDKKRLIKDIAYAPAWVGKHLREIARGEA
jgi:predicted transcriptional regulator of viral defense system